MKNHKTCGVKQALFRTYLQKKCCFLLLQIRLLYHSKTGMLLNSVLMNALPKKLIFF